MSNSSGTAKPDESKRELNEASHGQTGVEKWLDKVILIVTKMCLTVGSSYVTYRIPNECYVRV